MWLPDSAEIKEGKFAFFEDERKVSKDFWRILIQIHIPHYYYELKMKLQIRITFT